MQSSRVIFKFLIKPDFMLEYNNHANIIYNNYYALKLFRGCQAICVVIIVLLFG